MAQVEFKPVAIVASGGFNSGRLYSRFGQRIWWVQFEDGWLYFKDIDRMIDGWINREGLPEEQLAAPVLPGWLMRKYDLRAYVDYLVGDYGRQYRPDVQRPKDFDFGPALQL